MGITSCPDHGPELRAMVLGVLDEPGAGAIMDAVTKCPRCSGAWSGLMESEEAKAVSRAVGHAFASFDPPGASEAGLSGGRAVVHRWRGTWAAAAAAAAAALILCAGLAIELLRPFGGESEVPGSSGPSARISALDFEDGGVGPQPVQRSGVTSKVDPRHGRTVAGAVAPATAPADLSPRLSADSFESGDLSGWDPS